MILIGFGLGASPLSGQETGERARPPASVELEATGQAVRTGGANVSIDGRAESVTAAGANLRIAAEVAEDLRVAGAQIALDDSVGGDVWAADATVDTGIEVAGDMRLAGAHVHVGPGTRVSGALAAVGAEVVVEGQIAGAADLAGALVTFNGHADRSLSVAADRLVVGPDAVVSGDLIVLDETELQVQSGASIGGQTRREARAGWWGPPNVDPRPGRFGFALFAAGTATIAGLGLMLVGRRGFEEAAETVRARALTSGLIGIAALLLAPLAVALLALTVFGLPIAIGLLLLIPLVLILGYASAALGLGDWIINRRAAPRTVGRMILFLVAGALGLALISLVPYLGGVLVALAVIIGLGAFLRMLVRRLRTPLAPQPIS